MGIAALSDEGARNDVVGDGELPLEPCSDLHTRVYWYLCYAAADRKFSKKLYTFLRESFCSAVDAHMYSHHRIRLEADVASSLLSSPKWRLLLASCIAFVYQKNIAHVCGGGVDSFPRYKTARLLPVTSQCQADRRSCSLEPAALVVSISDMSLCHRSNYRQTADQEWIVYMAEARYPNVDLVIPLPFDIA